MTMRLAQVLDALDGGAKARRDAWHNGKLWIERHEGMGFAEITMTLNGSGGILDWPVVLNRGDWLADDWELVDEERAATMRSNPAPEPAMEERGNGAG